MNKQESAQGGNGAQDAGVVDLNERNWLPRYCRGEQQAFEQLLHAYRTLVYTFLVRYGVESQNRDDLFQDIFLKVHQAAPRYRPTEPLRPWLISIVLNTVRNFRRDNGRRKHFMTHLRHMTDSDLRENHAGQFTSLQPQPAGPDAQLERQSTVSWLEKRISSLPDRQREVLVMSTLKGLSMKEIANVLQMPENTVKTHLRRARLTLAESLAGREDQVASAG